MEDIMGVKQVGGEYLRRALQKAGHLKRRAKSRYYRLRFPDQFLANTSNMDVRALARTLLTQDDPAAESSQGFVHPHWQSRVATFRPYLTEKFSAKFLRDDPASDFVWSLGLGHWHKDQFAEVDSNSSPRVRDILREYREPTFGSPPNICRIDGKSTGTKFITPSTIDHFYYLHNIDALAREAGVSAITTYMEVGAGYGNMPHLIKLLHPKATIVLIDLVETSIFQYAYLSQVLPDSEVCYFHQNDFSVKEHAVNIVTLNHLHRLDWVTEVFLSSFALTESTNAFRQFVTEHDFYSAQLLFVTGGTDTRFSSDRNMQDVITGKFHDPITRDSMQPGCYEILAHRPLTDPKSSEVL